MYTRLCGLFVFVCVCVRVSVCVCVCVCVWNRFNSLYALSATTNQSSADFPCNAQHFPLCRLRVLVDKLAQVSVLQIGDEIIAGPTLGRWVHRHAYNNKGQWCIHELAFDLGEDEAQC